MPILDLPVNGEKPWGTKLNEAIEELNAAVDTKVEGVGITTILPITRTAYDALDPKDPETLYVIDEEA